MPHACIPPRCILYSASPRTHHHMLTLSYQHATCMRTYSEYPLQRLTHTHTLPHANVNLPTCHLHAHPPFVPSTVGSPHMGSHLTSSYQHATYATWPHSAAHANGKLPTCHMLTSSYQHATYATWLHSGRRSDDKLPTCHMPMLPTFATWPHSGGHADVIYSQATY